MNGLWEDCSQMTKPQQNASGLLLALSSRYEVSVVWIAVDSLQVTDQNLNGQKGKRISSCLVIWDSAVLCQSHVCSRWRLETQTQTLLWSFKYLKLAPSLTLWYLILCSPDGCMRRIVESRVLEMLYFSVSQEEIKCCSFSLEAHWGTAHVMLWQVNR